MERLGWEGLGGMQSLWQEDLAGGLWWEGLGGKAWVAWAGCGRKASVAREGFGGEALRVSQAAVLSIGPAISLSESPVMKGIGKGSYLAHTPMIRRMPCMLTCFRQLASRLLSEDDAEPVARLLDRRNS